MLRAGLSFVFIIGVVLLSCAQQVQVNGRFHADSLKIGEPVPFSLSARYPKNLNLVFPDSTFSFVPFEYSRKNFYPTQTTGNVSYDSVVYYLSSYEIDSVQRLRLPVFLLRASDSTGLFSDTDSIFLKHLVAHVPDTVTAQQLPLKANTSYLDVEWLFNYPILAYVIAGLTILAVAGWFLFGKSVRRYFRMRKLNRNHRAFLEKFGIALENLRSGFTVPKAENALVIWKQYMEGLDDKPYTKYTSREIRQLASGESLGSALQMIDRMIYGGQTSEGNTFSELRNYSESKFSKKLEEVKYG